MEERIVFTQALVELWSAELDEQAWWILVEHLKACNASEMEEFGQDAYKILEVLAQVESEAQSGTTAPEKLDQLAQLKALIKTQAIGIMKAHESLAAKVQKAEDGMVAFKTLFLEYDELRKEHRFLMDMRAVQLERVREEAAVKKIEALEQAAEILREAQRAADAIRMGN